MDAVVGQGMSCYWRPNYIPSAAYLVFERILDLAISDVLEETGFDQTVVVEQVGDRRRMELLGPDSPGEFSINIVPTLRDDNGAAIEMMRQEMIRVRRRILDCAALRDKLEKTHG